MAPEQRDPLTRRERIEENARQANAREEINRWETMGPYEKMLAETQQAYYIPPDSTPFNERPPELIETREYTPISYAQVAAAQTPCLTPLSEYLFYL